MATNRNESGSVVVGGDNNNTLAVAERPGIADYENIFGPAGRDVKMDAMRGKKTSRWHLPDALRGSNPWMADRIDGLITDATNSAFTSLILPYKYIDQVDAKIKWNVWSFDEGLASRVPYESAARTLTQTKRSYAGYTVRQGLAITMEHNFMMSEKGKENFQNQLKQMVGSIQYTNDIDVHIALVSAPSYSKIISEKYYSSNKTAFQQIREAVDLFGFTAKNQNAMDIMIEEAKSMLATWGAKTPTFMLTNSKLTFQMTMNPEKTNYVTQGPDGIQLLREGPNISTYRGLNIINTKLMSMEDGAPPRDILRRRVRVGEYYRIPHFDGVEEQSYSFYDESKDAWQMFTWKQLFVMANGTTEGGTVYNAAADRPRKWELLITRPCIEHNMMGIIIGRGGLEDLGATLWGQTELSVYDDSMHGVWGMSYKYNERAIVYNEKNLIRLWDIAYDGYNGGKDCTHLDWSNGEQIDTVLKNVANISKPYEGASMVVMKFSGVNDSPPVVWSSPIYITADTNENTEKEVLLSADANTYVNIENMMPMTDAFYHVRIQAEYLQIWDMIKATATSKESGTYATENETVGSMFLFQGSHKVSNATGQILSEVSGCGHHGPDYVGASAVRNGKGFNPAMHLSQARVC
jgi:hypothetical protein